MGSLVSKSRPTKTGSATGRGLALVGSLCGLSNSASVTGLAGWSSRGPEDGAPCRSAKASAVGRATVLVCHLVVNGANQGGCTKTQVAD